MTHKPIKIQNHCCIYKNKICFESFSTMVHSGEKIAVIGQNGSGKSSLLQQIKHAKDLSLKSITIPDDILIELVPQIIQGDSSYSGGERFQKAFSNALSKRPDILLLDEPTNHLDRNNRLSLFRKLSLYPSTLIVATHDQELLDLIFNKFWLIEDQKILEVTCSYQSLLDKRCELFKKLTQKVRTLKDRQIEMHDKLMKQQERDSKSKKAGEKKIANSRWMPSVGDGKQMRAEKSQGSKRSALLWQKQDVIKQMQEVKIYEKIVPKFHLESSSKSRFVLNIKNGSADYGNLNILKGINLEVRVAQKIAVVGDNGSGKTTLINAILNKNNIIKRGEWENCSLDSIGYLDQHYLNLSDVNTVFETIRMIVPSWTDHQIRIHLNSYLFRTNAEVHNLVSRLSGGEKVRLSLAQIGAKTPSLLMLDEVTNNLDLETITHLSEVLRNFPGALIVISHDKNFLDSLELDNIYEIVSGELILKEEVK